jgi:hypothetical protein
MTVCCPRARERAPCATARWPDGRPGSPPAVSGVPGSVVTLPSGALPRILDDCASAT